MLSTSLRVFVKFAYKMLLMRYLEKEFKLKSGLDIRLSEAQQSENNNSRLKLQKQYFVFFPENTP